jgi:hypothetical protein
MEEFGVAGAIMIIGMSFQCTRLGWLGRLLGQSDLLLEVGEDVSLCLLIMVRTWVICTGHGREHVRQTCAMKCAKRKIGVSAGPSPLCSMAHQIFSGIGIPCDISKLSFYGNSLKF